MRYRVIREEGNSKNCIVCGLANPIGLKAAFYETENNEVVAVFTPHYLVQSYPNRMHGGMITAILDEAIGRAISIGHDSTVWGVTMELTTKYHRPVPLDVELKAVGRVTEHIRSNVFKGTGELLLPDGRVAASATGIYMIMDGSKICDNDFFENEWNLKHPTPTPEEIEYGK